MGLHQARFFSIGSRLGNVAVLEEVESVIQDPLLHNQTIPENIPSENILLEEVTQFGDEATMESVESAIEEVLRVEEIAPEVSAPIEVSTTPSETIEDGQTITEAAGMNLEATPIAEAALTQSPLPIDEIVTNITPDFDAVEAATGAAEQISSSAPSLTVDPVNNILSSPVVDPSLIPLPPLPPIALPTPSLDLPFSELGLNSWWPPGWFQWFMEFQHVSLGLPWWATIVGTGILLRIVTFPLFVYSQRTAARNSNLMPEFTQLQQKYMEAPASGTRMEKIRAQNEMARFMKTSGYKPFDSFKPALFQMPIFMSMFIAIRKMVKLPVQSMTCGGLFWFTNLTVSDPYYLLPLFNALSLWLQLEYGVEMMAASKLPSAQKWMMRVMPMMMFPFLCFQSSALCCYWSASIWMSFLVKSILNHAPVRKYFDIPESDKPTKLLEALKGGKKGDVSFAGMKQGMKKQWRKYKANKVATSVEKKDETKWREAGIKGTVKTYKYDPTKVKKVV